MFFAFNATGQDTTYARELINKLCSPAFHGRGYVKNGDGKAAKFIADEFRKLNVDKVNGNYFQSFSFPVNAFNNKMELHVAGNKLIAGEDFIIHPASAKAKQHYTAMHLKKYASSDDVNLSKYKCYVVNKDSMSADDYKLLQTDLYDSKINTNAFIFSEPKKLTWSVSTSQFAVPAFTVMQNKLPKEGEAVFIKADACFNEQHQTQNVVGVISAINKTDSFIVFTAHYDHLGRMGKHTYFPGANDNASGISMLLNLAKHYSQNKSTLKYNVLFIAFAGEEAGLIGSKFYTEHPLFPLLQIKMLINMDLMGTGDDGMMVVNATEFEKEFELLKEINDKEKYVIKLGERGKAKNSDHYYFSENNVPAFFIYTLGGVSFYHDVLDRAETLPFTDFEDVFRLLRDFEESF